MKSYQAVYQILAKDTNYISGEKIAEELSLSRTSIWKAIKRLEQLIVSKTKAINW